MRRPGLAVALVFLCLIFLVSCGSSSSPETAEFNKHHDLAYEYYEQGRAKITSDPRQAHMLFGKAHNEAKEALESAPKNMPKTTWIRYQKMLGLANDALDMQQMLQRKIR